MSQEESTYDMIAIGDTTQDIFLEMSDAEVKCDEEEENCKICFDFADKIAVDKKTDVAAVGNAANHAIGIARLNLKAAIYTVVGNDTQGHLSQEIFEQDGVDQDYVVLDKEHDTNFSAVINFKGERTILVFHEPRDYVLPEFKSTRWIYLTSASGDGVKKLHNQTLEYLQANPDVQLSFNPGTHQMHLGKEELTPLLAVTSWLFLNREEACEVLETDTDDVVELVKGFHEMGVKGIVLTDGPDGVYVSDGEAVRHLGIYEGPVVERTGTGDAYGSGFMGAILLGKTVTEAMLWGNANSTSVVQFIGAREGLLPPEKIRELIEANPTVTPEEFAKLQ